MGLAVALAGCVVSNVIAGDFNNFADGDVLIGFRNGSDLVVDAGQVSTLTGLGTNATYSINTYTTNNFCSISLNGLNWSAFAWAGDGSLYMTKARTTSSQKSDSWAPMGGGSQIIINSMYAIPAGANDNLSFTNKNTATAVFEQNSSAGNRNYPNGQSYFDVIDPYGAGAFNFGVFQGDPEFTTAGTFTTGGVPARADFYKLPPNNGPVQWLGYFELSTNGTMNYFAYPAFANIQSFSRNGTTNTITYVASPYAGTATLRKTSDITTTPQTSWTSVATLNNDGSVHSFTFTDSSATEFYTITAQ